VRKRVFNIRDYNFLPSLYPHQFFWRVIEKNERHKSASNSVKYFQITCQISRLTQGKLSRQRPANGGDVDLIGEFR
jgi:hypothetical protein